MTSLQMPESTATPSTQAGRLRVVFLVRVEESAVPKFLAGYERIRHRVAAVDGHLGDQVCQSLDDPRQWMITSEWETPEHFLEWERSTAHREIVAPLVVYTTNRQSQRFVVARETTPAAVSVPVGGER